MVEKTVSDAYKGARGVLAAAGIEDAEFDARVLVELVTGKDPRVFSDASISDSAANALDKMIRLRASRYPLQYNAGHGILWILRFASARVFSSHVRTPKLLRRQQ